MIPFFPVHVFKEIKLSIDLCRTSGLPRRIFGQAQHLPLLKRLAPALHLRPGAWRRPSSGPRGGPDSAGDAQGSPTPHQRKEVNCVEGNESCEHPQHFFIKGCRRIQGFKFFNYFQKYSIVTIIECLK